MLEAIGERQFGTYFATIDRLLEPGGIACVQTILVPDQRWERYRREPDWIERYIFPGCLIPSLAALTPAMARALAADDPRGRRDRRALRRDAPPLARELSTQQIDEVRALGYDERFERTWDFYLAFCEAAFRTRALRDVAAHPDADPFNETLRVNALRRCSSGAAFARSCARCTAIEVVGGERIPASGPVHPRREPRVAPRPVHPRRSATTRPVRFMAKAELWRNRPWPRRHATRLGAFPVERGRRRPRCDLRARPSCSASGEVLGIFPQGTLPASTSAGRCTAVRRGSRSRPGRRSSR